MINQTGPLLANWPGRLHQGTARCTIGWMPINYNEADAPPYETVNATIMNFACPQLSIRYQVDGNYKAMVHIPMQEDNEYGSKVLTITMIVDERQQNYWALWRYMQTIQSGKTNGYPLTDKNSRVFLPDGYYRNRVTWIPDVQIHIADDSFQKWTTLHYMRCYPVEMSELSLNFSGPEPVMFTMSFFYSFFEVERYANETPAPCISR